MKDPLKIKSYDFAIDIVWIVKEIQKDQKEYILSKQLLKSGTAIGALIREAKYGRSKADFSNKLTIALKEANETEYWLYLLRDTDYLEDLKFKRLQGICNELISMLVSSVKTSRS